MPTIWTDGSSVPSCAVYSGAACADITRPSSFAPVWGSARWFGKSSNCRIALRAAFVPSLSAFAAKSMCSLALTEAMVGAKLLVALSSVALKCRRYLPEILIFVYLDVKVHNSF